VGIPAAVRFATVSFWSFFMSRIAYRGRQCFGRNNNCITNDTNIANQQATQRKIPASATSSLSDRPRHPAIASINHQPSFSLLIKDLESRLLENNSWTGDDAIQSRSTNLICDHRNNESFPSIILDWVRRRIGLGIERLRDVVNAVEEDSIVWSVPLLRVPVRLVVRICKHNLDKSLCLLVDSSRGGQVLSRQWIRWFGGRAATRHDVLNSKVENLIRIWEDGISRTREGVRVPDIYESPGVVS
jgi:hypothetical protein